MAVAKKTAKITKKTAKRGRPAITAKAKEEWHQLSFRVKKSELKKIDTIAKKEKLSRSKTLQKLISDGIIKKKAAKKIATI